MHRNDHIRLRHMLDAAREAISFVRGRSHDDLAKDRMLALSLVKSIEIIGEAASRISEDVRNEHQEVPWRNIVAMRNRLIHAYYDVDIDRVWDTVTADLPPLVEKLESILPPEELDR